MNFFIDASIRVSAGGTDCGCATFSAITSPLHTVSAPSNPDAAMAISETKGIKNASQRPMTKSFSGVVCGQTLEPLGPQDRYPVFLHIEHEAVCLQADVRI